MTQAEMEARLQALELVVLRAAAAQSIPQLPPHLQNAIETQAAPVVAKPKRKTKKSRPGIDHTGTVDDLVPAPAPKPDIAPKLQVISGSLSPLNAVLRDCKASVKSVEGIAPLCELNDVLTRANVKPSTGVKADNVKRAWATLVHFRATDDAGLDMEQVKADLHDFKGWAKDPLFIQCLNLDPRLAVAWFVDVMLATNGEKDDD